MENTVMSEELTKAFKLCTERVIEYRCEEDKILCIMQDLRYKVLVEMSDKEKEVKRLKKHIIELSFDISRTNK